MSNYVIGLTGGIACGKSNLSRALKAAGAPVLDADEISRAMTAPGGPALPQIRAAFGEAIFDGDCLNRRALANAIYADEEKRQTLNGIVHPMVFAAIRQGIEKEDGPVVLDVPLLYECGMDAWCDEIWCAYVPQAEQVRRIRKRDQVTVRQAMQRIRAQMPAREKAKRSDHMIRTDGSKEMSASIVLSLWNNVLARVKKPDEGEMH